jgi:hypothetical protein
MALSGHCPKPWETTKALDALARFARNIKLFELEQYLGISRATADWL